MIGSGLAVESQMSVEGQTEVGRYQRVRATTEALAEPLAVEDYVVQSMPDVSPTKWHLAHVTWFFETFVLMPHLTGYQPLNPAYQFLFNSYYLGAGERHCRDQRGYISRPTVKEVYEYRHHVDEHMVELLTDGETNVEVNRVVEIGLQHEQQHQELLLTDIKHVLSVNPLRPVYRARDMLGSPNAGGVGRDPAGWVRFPEGLFEVGAEEGPFSFDNERPRHRFFLDSFELADRPVTNAQFLEFVDDGGYERGDLWLSEGWAVVQERGWREPFYWEQQDSAWHTFTLAGLEPLDLAQPACHITYFEAEAYAQWAGARLPSEQEWEVASRSVTPTGNFADTGHFQPRPASAADESSDLRQMFGDVWEWTRSQYSPYPGYQPLPGTLGEYNGKFMSNQFVLRGGSCATPSDHIRHTYRNFFPADAAWQFSGIRLARDV